MDMRKYAAFLVLTCLLNPVARGGEFRIFTDQQGRAIEAKVISHDRIKGEVQLERQDGVRVWVRPNLFSADDQAYVKAWIDAYRVLSDDSLRVSIDKTRLEHVKKGMTDEERTTEGVESDIICYEITLRNRSAKPIENLKIDYRYFVETHMDGESDGDLKGIKPGNLSIDRIEPGEEVTVTTTSISIDEKFSKTAVYDTRFSGTSRLIGYEMDKKSEDELMGVWLKVYGPELEGEPTVRDVCFPENLPEDFDWDD